MICKILEKKVIGFKQDVRAFFTSKTNVAAISIIIGAGVAYASGQADAVATAQLIVPALIGLFVHDTVVGSAQ
ncbi:MAG: hypothetical protein PSX71_08575 [bacterium]|nr:hypothetical protein [bacterium]